MIRSTAIQDGNPELVEAARRGLRVLRPRRGAGVADGRPPRRRRRRHPRQDHHDLDADRRAAGLRRRPVVRHRRRAQRVGLQRPPRLRRPASSPRPTRATARSCCCPPQAADRHQRRGRPPRLLGHRRGGRGRRSTRVRAGPRPAAASSWSAPTTPGGAALADAAPRRGRRRRARTGEPRDADCRVEPPAHGRHAAVASTSSPRGARLGRRRRCAVPGAPQRAQRAPPRWPPGSGSGCPSRDLRAGLARLQRDAAPVRAQGRAPTASGSTTTTPTTRPRSPATLRAAARRRGRRAAWSSRSSPTSTPAPRLFATEFGAALGAGRRGRRARGVTRRGRTPIPGASGMPLVATPSRCRRSRWSSSPSWSRVAAELAEPRPARRPRHDPRRRRHHDDRARGARRCCGLARRLRASLSCRRSSPRPAPVAPPDRASGAGGRRGAPAAPARSSSSRARRRSRWVVGWSSSARRAGGAGASTSTADVALPPDQVRARPGSAVGTPLAPGSTSARPCARVRRDRPRSRPSRSGRGWPDDVRDRGRPSGCRSRSARGLGGFELVDRTGVAYAPVSRRARRACPSSTADRCALTAAVTVDRRPAGGAASGSRSAVRRAPPPTSRLVLPTATRSAGASAGDVRARRPRCCSPSWTAAAPDVRRLRADSATTRD